METRFRTLRFVAGLFKVLAWIMLVGGVIGAVGVIVAVSGVVVVIAILFLLLVGMG